MDLKSVVKKGHRHYLVSTVLLPIHTNLHSKVYETMVFRCNKNGVVKSWKEVFSWRGYAEDDARLEHDLVVQAIGDHEEDLSNRKKTC